MSTSPEPTTPVPPATAPRGRRADHLLATAVGIVLVPVVLALTAWARDLAEATSPRPWPALAILAGALAALSIAQLLFARRSSVGNLAAALTALGIEVVALLVPSSVPDGAAQAVAASGTVLALAALLLGGYWGMRRARRAGRAHARLSARLSAEDREIGVTPVAPPSRHPDHLLTLVACLTMTGVALRILPSVHTSVSDGTGRLGDVLLLVVAAGLLVAVTAFTGLSTLGARASGLLLLLLAVPALLGGNLAGRGVLRTVMPHGPSPVDALLVAAALLAVGWGSHLARAQGRSAERAERHETARP